MSRYYGTYDVEYKCSNCGKSFETFYCNGVFALPVITCRECKCKGTARKVAGSNTACSGQEPLAERLAGFE